MEGAACYMGIGFGREGIAEWEGARRRVVGGLLSLAELCRADEVDL